MPKATIVVPAYNVASTLAETLLSLEKQTFTDFEVVVVDDGSDDLTPYVAKAFMSDTRFRLVQQKNRGLAGARNRGIAEARGDYIGFCDADDLWAPGKLAAHVDHLDSRAHVGISYSFSQLIDGASQSIGLKQKPRVRDITAAHVLKRNPVGNGSNAVLRREVFEAIGYAPKSGSLETWYFDENFRQSEDIECWLRIALTTDWAFEGIAAALTQYRIVDGGLSAQTERQLQSWEAAVAKLRPKAPRFFQINEGAARAYQLRYLARRAVTSGEGALARDYMTQSLRSSLEPLWAEPLKSIVTFVAAQVPSAYEFSRNLTQKNA